MSTDVPLLFFWALALLAYLKMLDRPAFGWAVVLGLALGLGLLAKYAMIYFFVSVVSLSWVDSRARVLWRRPALWFALLLALIVVTPNLIWNAIHGWATFLQTEGNIVGGGFQLDLLGSLSFIAAQFAVCGPLSFAVFLLVLVRWSQLRLEPADRVMVLFALPPLVLVTIVAFVGSAKANWAAPSAISITILATALLVRRQQWCWVYASVGLGLVCQVILALGDAHADRILLPFLPQPNVYQRTMGWKAISEAIRQMAISNGIRTIAAEQNGVVASLLYYLRDNDWPIQAWPSSRVPTNQFEFDRPLTANAPEPVLFLSDRFAPDHVAVYYSTVEPLPPIEVANGPHSVRRLFAFRLSGVRRSIGPLAR
jgi:hypothetical protein